MPSHHLSKGKLIGGSSDKRRRRKRRKGDDSGQLKRGSSAVEDEYAHIPKADTNTLRLGLRSEKRKRGEVMRQAKKYGDVGSLSKQGKHMRIGQLSGADRGPMKRFRPSLPPAILPSSAQAAASSHEDAQFGTGADRADDGVGHVGGGGQLGGSGFTHQMKREMIAENMGEEYFGGQAEPDPPSMAFGASNVPTGDMGPGDIDQSNVGAGDDFAPTDDFVDLSNDDMHAKGTEMLHNIGNFAHEAPSDAYHLASTSGRNADSVSHSQHDSNIRGTTMETDNNDRWSGDPFAADTGSVRSGSGDPLSITKRVFPGPSDRPDEDMPQNTIADMEAALADIEKQSGQGRMALRGGAGGAGASAPGHSSGAPVGGLVGAGGVPPLSLPAHTPPAAAAGGRGHGHTFHPGPTGAAQAKHGNAPFVTGPTGAYAPIPTGTINSAPPGMPPLQTIPPQAPGLTGGTHAIPGPQMGPPGGAAPSAAMLAAQRANAQKLSAAQYQAWLDRSYPAGHPHTTAGGGTVAATAAGIPHWSGAPPAGGGGAAGGGGGGAPVAPPVAPPAGPPVTTPTVTPPTAVPVPVPIPTRLVPPPGLPGLQPPGGVPGTGPPRGATSTVPHPHSGTIPPPQGGGRHPVGPPTAKPSFTFGEDEDKKPKIKIKIKTPPPSRPSSMRSVIYEGQRDRDPTPPPRPPMPPLDPPEKKIKIKKGSWHGIYEPPYEPPKPPPIPPPVKPPYETPPPSRPTSMRSVIYAGQRDRDPTPPPRPPMPPLEPSRKTVHYEPPRDPDPPRPPIPYFEPPETPPKKPFYDESEMSYSQPSRSPTPPLPSLPSLPRRSFGTPETSFRTRSSRQPSAFSPFRPEPVRFAPAPVGPVQFRGGYGAPQQGGQAQAPQQSGLGQQAGSQLQGGQPIVTVLGGQGAGGGARQGAPGRAGAPGASGGGGGYGPRAPIIVAPPKKKQKKKRPPTKISGGGGGGGKRKQTGVTQARKQYTSKRKQKLAQLRSAKASKIKEFNSKTKRMPKAQRDKARRAFKAKVNKQLSSITAKFPTARGITDISKLNQLIRQADSIRA
jgi:hypothetical protein